MVFDSSDSALYHLSQIGGITQFEGLQAGLVRSFFSPFIKGIDILEPLILVDSELHVLE